ncbi:MAG: hypothetical protein ACI8U1_003218, partial [Rheinheimera aquimaris]
MAQLEYSNKCLNRSGYELQATKKAPQGLFQSQLIKPGFLILRQHQRYGRLHGL